MNTHVFSSIGSIINYEYYNKNASAERRAYLVEHWDSRLVTEIVKIDNYGLTRDGVAWYTFFLSDGTYGKYYEKGLK